MSSELVRRLTKRSNSKGLAVHRSQNRRRISRKVIRMSLLTFEEICKHRENCVQGGGPASEAKNCLCSGAESCEWSKLFVAGGLGPTYGCWKLLGFNAQICIGIHIWVQFFSFHFHEFLGKTDKNRLAPIPTFVVDTTVSVFKHQACLYVMAHVPLCSSPV